MSHPEHEDIGELRRSLIEALLLLERADEPLGRLDAVRRVRELADRLEVRGVQDARAAKVSWAKIGSVYGLTKQGAQQRFGERRIEPDVGSGGVDALPGTTDGQAAGDPAT